MGRGNTRFTETKKHSPIAVWHLASIRGLYPALNPHCPTKTRGSSCLLFKLWVTVFWFCMAARILFSDGWEEAITEAAGVKEEGGGRAGAGPGQRPWHCRDSQSIKSQHSAISSPPITQYISIHQQWTVRQYTREAAMANQHKTECSKFLIVTFSTLRPSLWQQCWKQSIQNKTIYFARNGNTNLAHGVSEVGVLYYKIK